MNPTPLDRSSMAAKGGVLLALLLASPLLGAFGTEPAKAALTMRTELSAQARDLGSMGALAERCAMDDPALVSRQVGIQVSAQLLGSSSPEDALAALSAFSQAVKSARKDYDNSSDLQKSRLCAFAWLGWRSVRDASSMATESPDITEAQALARSAGAVHGWLWRCHSRAQLAPRSFNSEISRQAALGLALGALSSSGIDELISTHSSWSDGFLESLGDEEFEDSQCPAVAQALPRLSLAFSRRKDLAPALRRAQDRRSKLIGLAL